MGVVPRGVLKSKSRSTTQDALKRYDEMLSAGHDDFSDSIHELARKLRENDVGFGKKLYGPDQLEQYNADVESYLKKSGNNTSGIRKNVGSILGETNGLPDVKVWTSRSKKTSANPLGLSLRGTTGTTRDSLNRALSEEVPIEMRNKYFKGDDAGWKSYKEYIKQGNRSNESLTGRGFNKGHLTSISHEGASHDPFAMRLENQSGNMGTGNKYDVPKDRLRSTGMPTSWDESIDKFKNPDKWSYADDFTPQDRQRVWAGEDFDTVMGERKSALAKNPNAGGYHETQRTHRRLNHPGADVPNPSYGYIKTMRTAAKYGALAGLGAIGGFGIAASASETMTRSMIAAETKDPMDTLQASVAGLSTAADFVPVLGEVVSTPADAFNLATDEIREHGFTRILNQGKNMIKRMVTTSEEAPDPRMRGYSGFF